MAASAGPRPLPFRIRKYECEEYLGGGMSDVYRARDLKAERTVVIKLLKKEECADEEVRTRFLREARLACRCSHPNIIATYETDEEDGQPYIAMEYLVGESLRTILRRGTLQTQPQAFAIALQIARALEYIHTLGIVHRDLKPDNVHIDASGHTKLLDFGVARSLDSHITVPGLIIGTPRYMSPEQVKGDKLTPASDIYSFGVLLFEMLTLSLPYNAQTRDEIWAATLYHTPDLKPLEECQVPTRVIALISQCLNKQADRRYPSFAPICEILQEFAQPAQHTDNGRSQMRTATGMVPETARVTRRNWLLPAAGGAGLGVVIGLAYWLYPRSPSPTLSFPSGDMLLVPAGVALLGKEQKQISVPAFYIDKTEVTNAAYLVFCRETGHPKPSGIDSAPPQYPVVNVSFDDASAFATWAKKRLPTADEWEKAARGASGSEKPYRQANIPTGHPSTISAADSLPESRSPYGALNMIGNVWEWINSQAQAPEGPELEQYRKMFPGLAAGERFYQIRGGSFLFEVPQAQVPSLVYDSSPMPAFARKPDIGFRCARDQ